MHISGGGGGGGGAVASPALPSSTHLQYHVITYIIVGTLIVSKNGMEQVHMVQYYAFQGLFRLS